MPDDEPKRRGRPRLHPKYEGPPRPRGRPPKVAVLEREAPPVIIVADPPPAPPQREKPSKGYTRI